MIDKGKKAMENPLMQNIHATLGEEDFGIKYITNFII